MKLLDKCQYLSKCALTPPLTKQQSTDNKLGYVRNCLDTYIDPSLLC